MKFSVCIQVCHHIVTCNNVCVSLCDGGGGGWGVHSSSRLLGNQPSLFWMPLGLHFPDCTPHQHHVYHIFVINQSCYLRFSPPMFQNLRTELVKFPSSLEHFSLVCLNLRFRALCFLLIIHCPPLPSPPLSSSPLFLSLFSSISLS